MFSELQPGQLARIPRVHAPAGELAPVVRVESIPDVCADATCGCWTVDTSDIETGRPRPYHRFPDFPVVTITPAA